MPDPHGDRSAKEGHPMADAYYHRGLTVEFDLSVPRVTVEGRELPATKLFQLLHPSDPLSVKEKKLRGYAQDIIEASEGFKKREDAVQEHLTLLRKGVPAWNLWRAENPTIRPLLYDAILTKDVLNAELEGVDFANAVLINADLQGQNLRGANFHEANLGRAKLHKADLTKANFCRTDLYETQMPDAILSEANLQGTQMAKTNLEGAKLCRCKVYGMSVWDVNLKRAEQRDLIIRYRYEEEGGRSSETQMTVDDLQYAQFIYLLLNNENIRNVIDSIGQKGVLILGRFTPERKAVLDRIRKSLRDLGFVPMLFDFERPTQRDFTETIKTLAGLSRFIIADVTNPKSSPLELQATMPDYMIPFVPIIEDTEEPFAMFRDLKQKYGDWVLDLLRYDSADHLIHVLEKAIVKPALEMGQRLLVKKAETIRARHVNDYM
jgi:hypothetical protein